MSITFKHKRRMLDRTVTQNSRAVIFHWGPNFLLRIARTNEILVCGFCTRTNYSFSELEQKQSCYDLEILWSSIGYRKYWNPFRRSNSRAMSSTRTHSLLRTTTPSLYLPDGYFHFGESRTGEMWGGEWIHTYVIHNCAHM